MSQIPIPKPDEAIVRVTPEILGEYNITGHKLKRLATAAVEMLGHVVGADGIREALATQQYESSRRSYVRKLGEGGLVLFDVVQTIQQAMEGELPDELDGHSPFRKEVGSASLSGLFDIKLSYQNNHPQAIFKGQPIQTSLVKSYSLRVDTPPSWAGTVNDTPIGSILNIDHMRTPTHAYQDGAKQTTADTVSSPEDDLVSDLHFALAIAKALVVPATT